MSYFANQQFNADEFAPSAFAPIPAGSYKAILTSLDLKDSKSGGKYLSGKFQIVDGDHSDRVIFANYNVENANPAAVEIGKRELADLCRGVGVSSPKSEEELMNRPLIIKIGIDKNDAERNVVKGYKPIDGATAPVVAPSQPSAAPKPAPWKRK